MADAHDKKEILHQNLVDAGCSDGMIEKCLTLANAGKYEEVEKVLSNYKKKMLAVIHKNEKYIDCLDFLIYKIKKEQ